MRELNLQIKECSKCPFKEAGKYTYIDSLDSVDYCILAKRTIYWTYSRKGFPEMCPLPIKRTTDEHNTN
jgi:hypothetical protein